MTHSFRLEMVVTRTNVLGADFDDALAKLREIEQFAAARGLVAHYAVSFVHGAPEPMEKN